MRFDVVTLFPEAFDSYLQVGFVRRGIEGGQLSIRFRSPRTFGIGRHKAVDDTPYGGGSGMVMRVDVLLQCIESMDADAPDGICAHRVLLTPQGAKLDQRRIEALARRPAVLLICGRYEGFDERVRGYVGEELSLGDFVMTGGEVAAMAVIDATVRLLPGVLGNQHSLCDESHGTRSADGADRADGAGLLEYPQYTRPAEFRGQSVPPVLVGGHHAQVETWRREQSILRTRMRRPDILAGRREP